LKLNNIPIICVAELASHDVSATQVICSASRVDERKLR
jgi:hypothetical protein